MAKLELVKYPSSALSSLASAVTSFDDQLRKLVNDMAETMYASGGVGLAAPQVNVTQRVLVIDPSAGEEANRLVVMVNPAVTWRSQEQLMRAEGCLSLPGVTLNVLRSLAVQVDYDDVNGDRQKQMLTDELAQIAQHEIDHLDGITMLDRVGRVARRSALKDMGLR